MTGPRADPPFGSSGGAKSFARRSLGSDQRDQRYTRVDERRTARQVHRARELMLPSNIKDVSEVRSRWTVADTKTIRRSPSEVENLVAEAVVEALDGAAQSGESRRWRASRSRPFSLFDVCEIAIALTSADEGSTSRVEIEVTFDASPSKVGLVMGLTTSVIGIPFGLAWRWHSTRDARAEAKAIIDALFRGLDMGLTAHAYR